MTSPLQNRITPMGEIIANSARGAWTGNRGPLASADSNLGRSQWKLKAWITCVLHWKGNRQPLMQSRTWTPLFFLDEATALAAGHRPCAYCRRDAFMAYAMAARPDRRNERLRAPEIDAQLHSERLVSPQRQKRLHLMEIDDVPDGAMIQLHDCIHLLGGDNIFPWSFSGYRSNRPRPTSMQVKVITPPLTLQALRKGYQPQIDKSASV